MNAKVDPVGSLGADAVVDYTTTDVTRTGETYDVIFDAVAGTDRRVGGRATTA